MKVLVATRESQGAREWDLWRGCVEGEIVRPIEERCSAHRGAACSCEVAFLGISTGGLTTTAVVRDLPAMTRREYVRMVRRSLTQREAAFVLPAPYAGELTRVASGLRGSGVVERWDEWLGFRFDDDGALRADITSIAAIDPAELEDIG
jgi:hypothetical protein